MPRSSAAKVIPIRPEAKTHTPHYVVGVATGELCCEAEPANHYSYPQPTVDAVLADLRAWGVCGTRRILREYDLAEVAHAIADVRAAVEAGRESGEYVRSPAALLVWTLRQGRG
jgi:hypothetical protein